MNKQFLGVRDRRHRIEVNNEIARIFQDVESFIEIQVRRGNGRRHYISFYKGNILFIKPAMKEAVNLFIFTFSSSCI